MRIEKTRRRGTGCVPVMGNLVYVVHSFGGRPVSVEAYQDEKAAIGRYRSLSGIVLERLSQEMQCPPELVGRSESTEGKSRIKTSRSGLPMTVFDNNESVCVVRGPVNGRRGGSRVPYIAVLEDGELDVAVFADGRDAAMAYEEIEGMYSGSPTFERCHRAKKAEFSVDEDEGPSVSLGSAKVIEASDDWRIRR